MASQELDAAATQKRQPLLTYWTSVFTTKALDFFSNASTKTLGACLFGGFSILYVLLGRLGLLLIGALAGIVLHETWEWQNVELGSDKTRAKRCNETGLEIARRLLEWRESRREPDEGKGTSIKAELASKVASHQQLDFSGYPPETALALASLVDAVIRDYVRYWYQSLLPTDESFPFTARQTLTGFLLALCGHQSHKRPADAFLDFLTNATSVFIVFLNELSRALMTNDVVDLEVDEALNLYIDRSPNSNLANMADEEDQSRRLLATGNDLLQTFLDPQTYNCNPARTFLNQVLAGVILQPILTSISQPEWINGWIIYLLEKGEPKLMNAIDAGVDDATNQPSSGGDVAIQLTGNATIDTLEMNTCTGSEEIASSDIEYQKRLGVAGDAMQAAMEEARRLPEMIQDSKATRIGLGDEKTSSAFTTNTQIKPNYSQDDLVGFSNTDSTSSHTAKRPDLPTTQASFTSFEQIIPPNNPAPEPAIVTPPLTLHRARVTIFDDSQPSDKSLIKIKPQTEYLLQVEPASSLHSGWMVPRKCSELESLHEYLYRIANISGVPEFARNYRYLPAYKGRTKSAFRVDIEQYLCDALSYEALAESEGMKRFLDKDQGFKSVSNNTGALTFAAPVGDAFQTVGKGVLGGFSTATKGVAAGGQAMFEGVGGFFGGPKRSTISLKSASKSSSVHSLNSEEDNQDARVRKEHMSFPKPSTDNMNFFQGSAQSESRSILARASHESVYSRSIEDPPALPPRMAGTDSAAANPAQTRSEIPQAIASPGVGSRLDDSSRDVIDTSFKTGEHVTYYTYQDAGNEPQIAVASAAQDLNAADPKIEQNSHEKAPHITHRRTYPPIDEQETRVAVELIFAAISELYKLSSAWNIRRTLLNAAKNYILRPGNPSLLSIKELLQSSVLDANLSDSAIAEYLHKITENALPTEATMTTRPLPMNEEEKEALRVKARRLLVTRGMPRALTGVMGAAASGEALGRVFDALQVQRVSRALMFSILLQGIRAVTH